MAVTSETLRLTRRLRTQLDQAVDQQTRDLVSAWVDAWDEVAPDLNAALLDQLTNDGKITRASLLRSKRLAKALTTIAGNLEQLAGQAGVRINGDLRGIIDTAGAAQASVIDSQLPAGTDLVQLDSWSRVDDRQIDAIVRRSTDQITSTLRPLPRETHEVVRRELIRGIAAGSNPRATAARMVKRTEARFNGQLGLSRALVISRTETLDAYREGARVAQLTQADVLRGWEWQATLDSRTCRSCLAKHGTEYALSDPGPEDHQQGRCNRLPVTMTWADLGITGVSEPASVLPDAEQWLAGQPLEVQTGILGKTGQAAWAEGSWPKSEWSRLRTTDGWRDSFGPAPQPSSAGRSSAAA